MPISEVQKEVIEHVLSSLPYRIFYTQSPITNNKAEVHVEPRHIKAYVIHDAVLDTIHVISTKRFRLIIDTKETHVMVPSRLVEKDTLLAILTITSRRRF